MGSELIMNKFIVVVKHYVLWRSYLTTIGRNTRFSGMIERSYKRRSPLAIINMNRIFENTNI
jgi:hypothetical protein